MIIVIARFHFLSLAYFIVEGALLFIYIEKGQSCMIRCTLFIAHVTVVRTTHANVYLDYPAGTRGISLVPAVELFLTCPIFQHISMQQAVQSLKILSCPIATRQPCELRILATTFVRGNFRVFITVFASFT